MNNQPLHILLVDDDEADQFLFKKALEELEIKPMVNVINNGIELMTYLTKENAQLPHLIFLDLNMPRKNGLDCLKEIRANNKLKDISVAIYSTSDNEKDIDETFKNKANIYITKPDDFSVLKQLLYKAVAATHLYHGDTFNKENFFLRIY
jgi:CheY-like chemotaxis protein